ncbi:RagB/SusD family nutrient uptake outer membrane protein [Mucilaginibacter sp. PAMB04274]|uniref:RagB/SusD family nutrient uptake outer membrane protein n=1 Tax=Mucilaginibacter sp. PAMB04274 TaxID=3138568 RepID=UPI0031F70C12
MNKKYLFATVLAVGTSVFTACNKERLNDVPKDSIVAETALTTPARIVAGVNGLYATIRSGTFYGGRYQVYNDIRGEDFQIETSNLVTGADVYQLNLANSATAVQGLWAQAYLAINRINVFLEGMEATGTATIGNAATSNAYIGEARFLRALCYYSLLQLYAKPYIDNNGANPGVPLRLTGNTGAGNYDLARASVAQVYDQILQDLNFAETAVPVGAYATVGTVPSATVTVTRAHRNTVISFKTRVLLTMQRYNDVIIEANKMVPTTAPFKATSGVAHELQADLKTVFTNYTTTESILSMPFVAGVENPGGQNQLGYYWFQNGSTPGVGEYAVSSLPNGILSNPQWGAADKRRTDLLFARSNKFWVSKFPTGGQYQDYAPVMRWPEVLLNLAEARARTAAAAAVPDAQALALLNAVHRRSDATVTLAPATNAALIDQILTERRIEFIGEGLRNIDLMRLRQTIPAKQSVSAKAPTEQGYIWPISANELILNKLAVDNK